MKFKQNWKRIFAGIMAGIMVFLSVDAGCITALAEVIQKDAQNVYPTGGLLPLEMHESTRTEIANFKTYELKYTDSESEVQSTYDWSKYGNYLIYNQLSSEWQAIWDDLDELCLEYLTKDIDGAEEEDPFTQEPYYFTKYINVETDITSTDFGTLYYLFMSSNPQYYFLGYSGYSYGFENGGTDDYIDFVALGIYEEFLDGEVRLAFTETFKTKIEAAYSEITSDMDEGEQLKTLHDYVIENVEYNHAVLEDDNLITNAEEAVYYTQSAYSALCTDYTVCAGYAEALQLLCNGLGLEASSVMSTNHQWIKVRINDCWYNVDPTWDDNSKDKNTGLNNPVGYRYFGRSDEFYTELDTNSIKESHVQEAIWDTYLPVCKIDTTHASDYVPGDFYVPTASVPTPKIVASKDSDGKYSISINVDAEEDEEFADAKIYYTLDGEEPSVASTKSEIYAEDFVVEKDTVIKAIALLDGYEDSDVAQSTAIMQMEEVGNKSHFYQKQTFVWKSVGEYVDGYIIKVFNSSDSTQVGEEIDIANGNTNFYLYDTSDLVETVNSIYYEIYGYVVDENEQKIPMTETAVSAKCVVNQLKEPLDVNVKWHVTTSDGSNLLVVNVEESTQDKLTLWYFTDKNGINSLNNFTLDMTDGATEFKYSLLNHGVAYDEVGYVLITDVNTTTAFQDNGFAVGGEYKEPILKPIEDILLESTGDTAILKAEIKEDSLMRNFNYKYQWYVAEDYTSEGIAIDGATSKEYEVKIGSFDEKYYYCEITAEYLTKQTYQTQNALAEDGVEVKHTRVQGALFNTNVTPDKIEDQTYDGTAKTPALTLRNELGETLVLDTDYTIQYKNNTNASNEASGDAVIEVDFIGNYEALDNAIINFKILPKVASEDTLEFTDVQTGKEYIYNGTAYTPSVEVKDPDRNVLLVPEGDYDIVYNANTNAGTATITLKFKGNYDGRVVIDFEILPKSAEGVTLASIADQTFTGEAIIPALIIKDGDKVLVVDKDYTVSCVNHTHVGVADVTIDFIGNYEGKKETKFDIVPRDASEVLITGIANQEYTGAEIEPTLEVIYRNSNNYALVLTKGTNYTVSYSNNIERGTATVTLQFDGDFKGTRTDTFTIVAKNAENLTYADLDSFTYNGTAHEPEVEVLNGELKLEKGIDYVVEYKNNVNAGTGTAIVKFEDFEGCSGNYAGTKELNFQIAAKAATECEVKLESLDDYTFTGSEIKPGVVAKDGDIVLVERTEDMDANQGDYYVEYSNNINAGKATVTITFINNYTGESTQTFTINKKEITESNIVIEDIANQTYQGAVIIPSDIVVKETASNFEAAVTLRLGVDYTVSAGAENVYVGTGVVKIHIELDGESNYIYAGEDLEASFTIVPRDASNVTISPIPEQRYTGQEITPELEVKDGDIVLVYGVDYTIEYADNIEVSTDDSKASVIIHFTGNFTGEDKTAVFTIIDPIPESITSSVFYVSQSNGYISKITAGTTVYTLWNAINEQDYVSVFDKNGDGVAGDKVLATGMTAGIMDEGEVVKRYTIIVTGDVSGDGKINITDMVAVQSHILKKSILTDEKLLAGDVNKNGGDGKVNITDLVRIQSHVLKVESIVGISVN